MSYFQNRAKYVSPSGLLNALKQLMLAISRALRRNSNQVKGRKRLYASSLAFKTVLALVPALAILMAVLSGNAFTQKREQLLDKVVDLIYPVETAQGQGAFGPPEPQDLRKLKETGRKKIHSMVNQLGKQAEKMGLAGSALFILVLFLLSRDTEDAFNFLWGVEKSRPFFAQFLRCGVLLIGIPLLTVAGLAMREKSVQWFGIKPGWFLSLVGVWLFCVFLYKWMPNVRVRWRPAILGGVFGAVLLECARWVVNWYTLNVVASSKIYGALWMVPVILIWFYLSWAVILFGAEVAYFVQKQREESSR